MIGYGILVPFQEAVATIARYRGMSETTYLRSLQHYWGGLIQPIPYVDDSVFVANFSSHESNVFIGIRMRPYNSAMSQMEHVLNNPFVQQQLNLLGFGQYEPQLYYSTDPMRMDLVGVPPLSKPKVHKLN
jgi:hypothetical protein